MVERKGDVPNLSFAALAGPPSAVVLDDPPEAGDLYCCSACLWSGVREVAPATCPCCRRSNVQAVEP